MDIEGEDRSAIAEWRLGEIISARVPSSGTINRTLLVDLDGGDHVFNSIMLVF